MLPLALALAAQVTLPVAGPASLDFGVRSRDCVGTAGVAGLVNQGDRPVRVEDVRLEGAPGLVLDPAPARLAIVRPGQRWPVGLRPNAPAEGAFFGRLVVETSRGTVVTRLSGAFADVVEDRHVQLSFAPREVLFVIDGAPSMAEARTAIQANVAVYLSYLERQSPNARFAVTTLNGPDAGRLRRTEGGGRFVSLADPRGLERAAALADVPTRDFDERRGFEAVLRALEALQAQDFLRPDGALSVVVLSDRDDQSDLSTPAFVDALKRVVGFRQRNRLSFSSIVGDAPGGCTGPAGSARAGRRYIRAAEQAGGTFASICSDSFVRALETLAVTAFGFKSRFYLSASVQDDLQVFVGGAPLPERSPGGTINWTYDAPVGSLNFSPFATPAPGAEIVVRYRPGCPFARPSNF